MSLRVRLIVVFFLLSVVPLGAVTYYLYTSNVRAVRDAAARESDLLAGELSQRMQLVTAQLSERVEHLTDLQNLQASAAATQPVAKPAPAKPAPAKPAPAKPAPAVPAAPPPAVTPAPSPLNMDQIYEAKVAQALGEAAMLLNNVELRGMGPRGDSGRQGRPPSRGDVPGQGPTTPPPPGVTPPPIAPTAPVTPVPGISPPPKPGAAPPPGSTSGQRASGGNRTQPQHGRSSGGGAGGRGANAAAANAAGTSAGTGGQTGSGTGANAGAAAATDAANAASRLMIDLAPIRREILKQIVPEGHLESLTPEERQRIGRELNQRMLGIAQGLQLGAAGLQKRAADAEREAEASSAKATQAADALAKSAEAKANAAGSAKAPSRTTTVPGAPVVTPTPTPAATPTPAPMKKKTALTGSHLGVMVEQNGQVVEQVSAEVNLPQLLATVFSTTRRDRGRCRSRLGKTGRFTRRLTGTARRSNR